MAAPKSNSCTQISTNSVEIPTNVESQRALHEAVGHLYDELAIAAENGSEAKDQPSKDVFDALEALYVGTAEESIEAVEIRYKQRE